jgi:cyanate permease
VTSSPASVGAGRPEVLTVYAIGLFQGLSLVAFPAAATILTAPSGYDLSKSQYGVLFVPQVAMAIIASLALPTLGNRFALKRVLMAGLIADAVAMALHRLVHRHRRVVVPAVACRHRAAGPARSDFDPAD